MHTGFKSVKQRTVENACKSDLASALPAAGREGHLAWCAAAQTQCLQGLQVLAPLLLLRAAQPAALARPQLHPTPSLNAWHHKSQGTFSSASAQARPGCAVRNLQQGQVQPPAVPSCAARTGSHSLAQLDMTAPHYHAWMEGEITHLYLDVKCMLTYAGALLSCSCSML